MNIRLEKLMLAITTNLEHELKTKMITVPEILILSFYDIQKNYDGVKVLCKSMTSDHVKSFHKLSLLVSIKNEYRIDISYGENPKDFYVTCYDYNCNDIILQTNISLESC